MDDEAIIAELVAIRGIGRWTAEMFLIFHLMRPNVLPLDDVGLINGISHNYFSRRAGVSRSDAREVAEAWAPYCSGGHLVYLALASTRCRWRIDCQRARMRPAGRTAMTKTDHFLDFEQPIAELETKIEELRFVQDDSAVDISEEIDRLARRASSSPRTSTRA